MDAEVAIPVSATAAEKRGRRPAPAGYSAAAIVLVAVVLGLAQVGVQTTVDLYMRTVDRPAPPPADISGLEQVMDEVVSNLQARLDERESEVAVLRAKVGVLSAELIASRKDSATTAPQPASPPPSPEAPPPETKAFASILDMPHMPSKCVHATPPLPRSRRRPPK